LRARPRDSISLTRLLPTINARLTERRSSSLGEPKLLVRLER
jgi:hypothetical protein